MFASTHRVLKFAFQDFFRNFWLSLVTLTIVVLALLSINMLIIFNTVAAYAISSIEDTIDITVYFKPEVTDQQVAQTQEYLRLLSQVDTVTLIGKDDALALFKEKHKDNEKIMKSLEEIQTNPLGSSLVVKAKTPDAYPAILERLQDEQYAQLIDDKDFDDHRTVIGKVTGITGKINAGVTVVALIFSLISIMIIFNTIRVAIYTHRDEIRAMKLVGATDMFVRAPFLLESTIFSVLALLITIAIIYPFLGFIQPYLSELLGSPQYNIVNEFNANAATIFGYQFLGVVTINIISSAVAVGKYLRV